MLLDISSESCTKVTNCRHNFEWSFSMGILST